MSTTTTAAVEAVWRIESGRLVAALARLTGDFSAAEDLAQDALEIALRQWPRDGIPNHPASWLMATAKHVATDYYRRQVNLRGKLAELARQESTAQMQGGDPMAAVDEELESAVHDDLLRLVFTACHPVLSIDSQVALTLRTVGGLRTGEIARAFLTRESTMAQRISRAKKTLKDSGVRFELPAADELPARLEAVLAVIYLIFNEGYSATAGADWTRPALCHDAIRLGRVLVGLQPREPEVHGLVALMELQASRLAARNGPAGEPVLLGAQDRRLWDRLLIARGLTALQAAEELGGGPYTVQAAIAACHARADSVAGTDWRRIAALYTVAEHLSPSGVIRLNRAVAIGMADGPARGLEELDLLGGDATVAEYPHLAAARGTFLAQLGQHERARAEFEHAATQTSNLSERQLFLQQANKANDRGVAPNH